MKAGGMFVLGGLLAGAGKGISDVAEQQRQNALLKLQREWKEQDQASEAVAAEAARAADLAGKKEIIDYSAQADVNKTTKIREVDYGFDVKMEKVKADLDMKKDAASKRVAAAIDSGQVQSTRIGENGELVVIYKNGTTKVEPGIKLNISNSDDEPEPTIAGERGNRGGNPPAPKADPNADARARALAALGNAYHHATPEKYPGLFRNGKKIPMAEAKEQIYQRFGR